MNDTIKKRVADRFSQKELAYLLGSRQQNVSRWLNSKIPPRWVIPLCKAMDWTITPHEINPDGYPNPTDGLPVEDQVNTQTEQRVDS